MDETSRPDATSLDSGAPVAAKVVDDISDPAHAERLRLYPSQSVAYHGWLLLLGGGLVVAAFLLQGTEVAKSRPDGESTASASSGLHRTTRLRLPGTASPLPEICLSKRMFGVRCPGCGLTRSVVTTARGDLQTAFLFHPAGPLVFLWAALQIPYRLGNLWRLHKGLLAWRTPGTMMTVILIGLLCVGQWMVRMGDWWG